MFGYICSVFIHNIYNTRGAFGNCARALLFHSSEAVFGFLPFMFVQLWQYEIAWTGSVKASGSLLVSAVHSSNISIQCGIHNAPYTQSKLDTDFSIVEWNFLCKM